MTFLSIFEDIIVDIGKVAEIAAGVAPLISFINPLLGQEILTIANIVIALENLIPVPKQGALKKQIATQILVANGKIQILNAAQVSALIDVTVLGLKYAANQNVPPLPVAPVTPPVAAPPAQ